MKKYIIFVFVFSFVLLCACKPVSDPVESTDNGSVHTTEKQDAIQENTEGDWELPIDIDDSVVDVTETVTEDQSGTEVTTDYQENVTTDPEQGSEQTTEDNTNATERVTETTTEGVTPPAEDPTEPEPTVTVPAAFDPDGPIELPLIPG